MNKHCPNKASLFIIFVSMVRLLSYLYPITKKIKSDVNGVLEITWYNGKKHLNSKNANYSYGSLQRILKFGLEKIDLHKVRSVLLLGLGGGSVIKTLHEDFNFEGVITAVDIDSEIIKIAKEEFALQTNNKLHIICDDALNYVAQNSSTYDLIIVDLFIDTEVPKQFLEHQFWQNVIRLKSAKGCLLFNASLKTHIEQNLETVISYLKTKVYKVDVYEKVNDTNTVVVANSI